MMIKEVMEALQKKRQWYSDDEDTANIERRFGAAERYREQVNYLDMAISALAESQRRERAAVEDLREHAAFAATCNRYGCGYDCQSPRCPGWQWRGPQEGEGNAETDNPD